MNWSQKAIDALDLLVRDVDPAFRERTKHRAIQEIEDYCKDTRIREVGFDQVVVGYIRATPSGQRMALRSQMRVKGIPVEKFEQHFLSPV